MRKPKFKTPQDSSIYYLTKRMMAVENANKKFIKMKEFVSDIKRLYKEMEKLEGWLHKRIKVLEDARTRQIKLNGEVLKIISKTLTKGDKKNKLVAMVLKVFKKMK